MALNKQINVLISSRNSAEFDGEILSDIRDELRTLLEKEKIFGRKLIQIWINEKEDPQSFNETIWNKCLNVARQSDIVLILYNGETGWLKDNDTIGICHAEMLEAMNVASGKVWAIKLGNATPPTLEDKRLQKANENFQNFVETNNQIFSKPVFNKKELIQRTKECLIDAIYSLVKKGVILSAKSKSNYGEALVWKRKNYDSRSVLMIKALKDSIDVNGIGYENNEKYFLNIEDNNILLLLHSIPDSVSIANARERVGQPFLQDYRNSKVLKENENIIGPVHIIACHKTITETQARNILGFPDATILKDSFGIYVADNIQKIQMVFLSNCSDSYSTAHTFQEFINWMERTEEMEQLIKRAISRKKIIITISDEN
jgi:hypothetical protein